MNLFQKKGFQIFGEILLILIIVWVGIFLLFSFMFSIFWALQKVWGL